MSVVVFLFSFLLPLVSVHTYCENRTFAALYAFGAGAVSIFLLLARPESRLRRVLRGLGLGFCVLSMAVNVAFIAYATRLCRHMFDHLH